jgi:hypothetical protein
MISCADGYHREWQAAVRQAPHSFPGGLATCYLGGQCSLAARFGVRTGPC